MTVKVLLVEDNEGNALLIREMLGSMSGEAFKVKSVEQLADGLACLSEGGVDVVLLDLSLPDSQGLATFKQAHAQAGETPIIVLTGLNDDTVGVRAVHEGAQDYLVKGQLNGQLLTRSIRYAIERKRGERVKRDAEALWKVAALARAAAHEINNPLAIVKAGLMLLTQRSKHESSEDVADLDVALHAVERIHEIITRMGHITQLEISDKWPELPPLLDLHKSSQDPEFQPPSGSER